MNLRIPTVMGACAVLLGGLVFGAPASAQAAKCEPQKVATKYPALAGKTIKIGVSAADRPTSFRDENDPNKITGFDPEFAKAVFACIGVPIEFSVGGWSGLMPALVAGQTDVMWDGLYYTPERAKSVDYVLYTSAGSAIVVNKGNPKNIHSLNDLCGLKSVSQIGSTEIATMQRTSDACVAAHKPEVTIVASQDRPSGLLQLTTGRVDAYLGIAIAAYDPALTEIVYTYSTGIKIGVGVGKGNKALEQAIYDSIRILQADGTATKLYAMFHLDPALDVPVEIALQ